MKILMVLGFALFFCLSMYITYAVSAIAGVVMMFLFVALDVFWLVRSVRKDKKTADYIELVPSSSSIGESGKIHLKKRDPENEYRFLIDKHVEVGYGYVPPSATFTAVSVGGVTTGGWDVQEGHYKTSSVKKTDKYELFYTRRNLTASARKGDIICCVKEIVLTSDDVKTARSFPILNQFVVGNSLVLRHNVQSAYSKEIASSIGSGDIYSALNLGQDDLTKMALTQKEAQAVLDFICGRLGNRTVKTAQTGKEKDRKSNTSELCVHLYKKTGICGSAWSDCNGSPCRGPQNCKLFRSENSSYESKSDNKQLPEVEKPARIPTNCRYFDASFVCQCKQSAKYLQSCRAASNCEYYDDGTKKLANIITTNTQKSVPPIKTKSPTSSLSTQASSKKTQLSKSNASFPMEHCIHFQARNRLCGNTASDSYPSCFGPSHCKQFSPKTLPSRCEFYNKDHVCECKEAPKYQGKCTTARECAFYNDKYQANQEKSNSRTSSAEENEPISIQSPADNKAAEKVKRISEELREYKELLDDELITQEEYDAKKKQLLGL